MPKSNNKIGNTAAAVPKTPSMTDRDFLTDCLSSEKYMTQSYATAVHEMSHHSLYKDIHSIYTETQQCQRELYNLMFEKGWYNYTAAPSQEIQQTTETFSQYPAEQFPKTNLM